jgi:hypothetical protein
MAADAHVSTGRLPSPERVHAWVEEAHARFADDASGAVSRVCPALAEMPAQLFGICVEAGWPPSHRGWTPRATA